DPGLTQCRELVNIPVIGPLEASVMLSRLFGHSFAVVTDHRKAVPELRDRVRLYGLESNCRSVDAIDWYVTDMVLDPMTVAKDTYVKVQDVLRSTGAETVVIGCTIVSACYELAVLRGDADLAALSVINPNVMAVKLAEMFADLNATKQYRISRVGYYQQHTSHDADEAAEIMELLTGHSATKPDVAS
ncbi:MAG TPA: aspartate/glutamate racemase family protein, partial [Ilumatobacteraceae bacterium]|nr:aspartate/glutamate racemase family protein [Ilumatobacteraceae bacterium]